MIKSRFEELINYKKNNNSPIFRNNTWEFKIYIVWMGITS